MISKEEASGMPNIWDREVSLGKASQVCTLLCADAKRVAERVHEKLKETLGDKEPSLGDLRVRMDNLRIQVEREKLNDEIGRLEAELEKIREAREA